MKIFVFSLILALVFKAETQSIDEAIADANDNSMAQDLVSSESSNLVRKELDIIMTLDEFIEEEKERMAEKEGRRKKRKAIRATNRRWPSNIIPYEIAANTFSSANMAQINAAINEWNTQTCLVMRPRSGETAAVRFQNGNGCSSFIGRTGNIQPISLANGCRIRRIITHEIGHAVGFWHEQSRPDRDGFVQIVSANIPDAVLFNFEKQPMSQVNSFGVAYDYRSVMHYGARAFSNNGGITVRTVDASFQNIIGTAPGLSFRDIKLANLMYNCASSCAAQSCPGEGFVGKDCVCKCPTNDPNNPVQNCQGTPVVTTTSQPTARPAPTVTTPSACEDMNRYCGYWARAGYCPRSRYMMMYCKQSCNKCNAPKRCEDMGTHCTFLSSRGLCTNRFARRYMEFNCPATCQFCQAGQLIGATNNQSNKAARMGSAPLYLAVPIILLSLFRL